MKDGWAALYFMSPAMGFFGWGLSLAILLNLAPVGFVYQSMVALPWTIFCLWAILRFMKLCLDKGFQK